MPFFTQVSASTTSDELTATAPLGGHKAVVASSSGPVYASADDLSFAKQRIGLSVSAAGAGEPLKIVWSGIVNEPSWNWTVDMPVFLGLSGGLTQTPPSKPSSLFRKVIGIALSPTSLMVDPESAVAL